MPEATPKHVVLAQFTVTLFGPSLLGPSTRTLFSYLSKQRITVEVYMYHTVAPKQPFSSLEVAALFTPHLLVVALVAAIARSGRVLAENQSF